MKTQEEINKFFKVNSVKSIEDLFYIKEELVIYPLLTLPENITINSSGITIDEFTSWFGSKRFAFDIKDFPKTYKDCCDVLGLDEDEIEIGLIGVSSTEPDYESFIKLIRCRNAYWKIVGFAPASLRYNHYLTRSVGVLVSKEGIEGDTHILEFPTHEVIETFCTNFGPLIKKCERFL